MLRVTHEGVGEGLGEGCGRGEKEREGCCSYPVGPPLESAHDHQLAHVGGFLGDDLRREGKVGEGVRRGEKGREGFREG